MKTNKIHKIRKGMCVVITKNGKLYLVKQAKKEMKINARDGLIVKEKHPADLTIEEAKKLYKNSYKQKKHNFK